MRGKDHLKANYFDLNEVKRLKIEQWAHKGSGTLRDFECDFVWNLEVPLNLFLYIHAG